MEASDILLWGAAALVVIGAGIAGYVNRGTLRGVITTRFYGSGHNGDNPNDPHGGSGRGEE